MKIPTLRTLAIGAALAITIISVAASHSPSERYLRDRVVKLINPKGGSCSGEQVRAPSGVDYILSAAHCMVLQDNGSILVETEDGKQLPRRIIAEDMNADLVILEGLPGVRGIDIAKADHRAEHVRTLTHGRGMPTYKTVGELIQTKVMPVPIKIVESEEDIKECLAKPKQKVIDMNMMFWTVKVCALSTELTTTSAEIVPGSSGGMVLNDAGELVGVVSAGDGVFGYLVTIKDINSFIRNF